MRSLKPAQFIAPLCAILLAVPALAQMPGSLKPIPKAGSWMLADELSSARGCTVMQHGDSVDVNLLLDKDGQMLLVASRPDWKFDPGTVKFQLRLDAGPTQPMEGDALANLVVTHVDAKLETALYAAKELAWKVPGGEYHARITGLKTAFEALKACNVRKGVQH